MKKTIKANHGSIKSYGLICACIALFFSCATKKYQIATSFVDTESGEQLTDKSVGLKKGKIIYINTCEYENPLTDNRLFNKLTSSNFLAGKFSPSSTYVGAAHYGSKIDTTVTNNFISLKTLYNVIKKTLPGFEYEFVEQENFSDENGELCLDILYEKYKPDIIINLTELYFKIHGEANTGTSVSSTPTSLLYSGHVSRQSSNSYYGAILIDYTANWEIIKTEENKTENISHNGRFITKNWKNYSISEELSNSTEKIAREFSELLYKLK